MTKNIDITSGSGSPQAASCWRLVEYFDKLLPCAFSAPSRCTSGNFLRKDTELDRPLIWPTRLFWSPVVQIMQRNRINERTKLGRSACWAQLCFHGTNPIKMSHLMSAMFFWLPTEKWAAALWEALTTQILSGLFPYWQPYDSLSCQAVYCTILA